MKVSIIIPVLNQKQQLSECLEAIFLQDFPKESFEVIVIDNGSTDGSWELLDAYRVDKLRVLDVKSPYTCRNMGALAARGEVLVFCDSRVVPTNYQWLKNGYNLLIKNPLMLVSGKLGIKPFGSGSISQWCEVIEVTKFNLWASEGRSAQVANLFVLKSSFEKTGLFQTHRSGADMEWIRIAMNQGTHICYAHDAEVLYDMKTHTHLVRKQVRLGVYKRYDKSSKNVSFLRYTLLLLLQLRPPNPYFIQRVWKFNQLRNKNFFFFLKLFFGLWYYRSIKVFAALGLNFSNPD